MQLYKTLPNLTLTNQFSIAFPIPTLTLLGAILLQPLIQISLATRCQFHQRSTYSFYARSSQKHKKILSTWLSSYALGSYGRKSCK